MSVKSYDQKSYDLAAVFLLNEPNLNTEMHRGNLARVIRGAIEEYIKLEKWESSR